jgi:hypothetical protein
LEIVARLWHRFADAAGAFLEEAAARTSLAWAVLRGRSPKPVEKRWWNRDTETPVLIDVFDWTDERHIFSALVWPPLDAPRDEAHHRHDERVSQVLEVIARGATEMAWSTRWEVDYGLRWDHKRQVWAATDGFAYAPPERVTGGGG